MNYCPFLENIYRHINTLINPNLFTFKDFFYTFLSALLGVLFGYFFAQYKYNKEKSIEKESLKENLIGSFKFNLEQITQCIDYLNKDILPNFTLDDVAPKHMLLHGKHLFDDNDLYKKFSWQCYQLTHINSKLAYMHIYIVNGNNQKLLLRQEYASLIQQLQVLYKEISTLLLVFEKTP